MKKISPGTRIGRNPEMVFNEMDEEIVMMSIENSEYYGLDPVASRIWELLDKPATIDEIVKNLLQEYEIDEKTCLEDVLEFSEELLGKNIIVIL
jgi:hypothetical protein